MFKGVTATFAIGLFKVSTSSGIVTQVAALDEYSYSTVKWSPDGQYIVCTRGNSTEAHPLRVMLMDGDGANERTLQTLPVGSDVESVVSSLSFRKASTDPNPGPGPIPVPPTLPSVASGTETSALGAGHQREQIGDLSIEGLDGATVLSRTYPSHAAGAKPSVAVVVLDDGRHAAFVEMPDGSWRSQDWARRAVLSSRADGAFRFRLPSQDGTSIPAVGWKAAPTATSPR